MHNFFPHFSSSKSEWALQLMACHNWWNFSFSMGHKIIVFLKISGTLDLIKHNIYCFMVQSSFILLEPHNTIFG